MEGPQKRHGEWNSGGVPETDATSDFTPLGKNVELHNTHRFGPPLSNVLRNCLNCYQHLNSKAEYKSEIQVHMLPRNLQMVSPSGRPGDVTEPRVFAAIANLLREQPDPANCMVITIYASLRQRLRTFFAGNQLPTTVVTTRQAGTLTKDCT